MMKKSLLKINDIFINSEVAITHQQQCNGLMNRFNPPVMTFLFSEAMERSFWMKDTPHPLLICFCNKGLVDNIKLAYPNDLTHITGVADMVVEIPVGQYVPKCGDDVKIILSSKDAESWIDENLLNI